MPPTPPLIVTSPNSHISWTKHELFLEPSVWRVYHLSNSCVSPLWVSDTRIFQLVSDLAFLCSHSVSCLSLCSLAVPHLLPACRSRVGNALKGSIHNWRKSSLYTLLIVGLPSLFQLQASQLRTSMCHATQLSCITCVFTKPTILFEKEIRLEISRLHKHSPSWYLLNMVNSDFFKKKFSSSYNVIIIFRFTQQSTISSALLSVPWSHSTTTGPQTGTPLELQT